MMWWYFNRRCHKVIEDLTFDPCQSEACSTIAACYDHVYTPLYPFSIKHENHSLRYRKTNTQKHLNQVWKQERCEKVKAMQNFSVFFFSHSTIMSVRCHNTTACCVHEVLGRITTCPVLCCYPDTPTPWRSPDLFQKRHMTPQEIK